MLVFNYTRKYNKLIPMYVKKYLKKNIIDVLIVCTNAGGTVFHFAVAETCRMLYIFHFHTYIGVTFDVRT